MPTIFVSGDLFHHAGIDALAHGCNCAGAMGKGIAVEFRTRFPEMFVEYKKRCAEGRFKPGDVFAWKANRVTIFNLGTQKTWKTRATKAAVDASLEAMVTLAEQASITRIGLPRIGAGYGGLEWTYVRGRLVAIGSGTQIDLVVFEEYVPRAQSA